MPSRAAVRCSRGLLEFNAVDLVGGVLDCLDDVLVAGAAADIARDPYPDLFFRRPWVFLEQPLRADDHAGRAEAALQAVHHAETFLQRRQRTVGIRHALDRDDFRALGLHRKHGAALHRHAVEIDGAGAAMGGLAADMGAGEREIFAQEMHQQRTRFDEAFDLGAVHLHGHVGLCHCFLSLTSPGKRRVATPASP
jgi:hypothetical protein